MHNISASQKQMKESKTTDSNKISIHGHPSAKLSYREKIACFYQKHNLFMKIETLHQHIEEKHSPGIHEVKSIEIVYQYLDETISQLLREILLLDAMILDYEKLRWWRRIWWEPDVDIHLSKLSKLIIELNERFAWYERLNNVKVKSESF